MPPFPTNSMPSEEIPKEIEIQLEEIIEKVLEIEEYEDWEDSGNSEDQNQTTRTEDEEKQTKFTKENIFHSAAEGGVFGVFKNATQYIVKVGGRKSNIVNIYDKTVKSARGNAKWFARVDKPHGNVPYHHINVNKAVTGVPDPHIKISPTSANIAGGAGKVLNMINKAAPVLVAVSLAYEAYKIGCEVKKDIENHSSRNTIEKSAQTAAATAGGAGGCAAGAFIGTMLFPGVGTMIGGLVGGMVGGIGGGIGGEVGSEAALEYFEHNIDSLICKNCRREFKNRRYKEGVQEQCKSCRKNALAVIPYRPEAFAIVEYKKVLIIDF